RGRQPSKRSGGSTAGSSTLTRTRSSRRIWCLPVRTAPALRRPWLRWSATVYDRRGDRSHVDGVRAQRLERAPFGGRGVCGGEIHGRCDAGLERLLPSRRAEAPTVAGHEAGEAGPGRGQIVARLDG